MSAILGKAGKKLFAKNLQQYAPQDPLYETYTDDRGRQKRKKRDMPPGLSKRDARILKSVQRRAHYLDKGFNVCGLRFGWTFFIGLIPIVGDVTDASLNYFLVVRKARQADLPQWLVQRMLLNNAISAGVGFVPMVGDVILAVYKANSRNAALLEEFLRIRGEEFLKLNSGGEVVEAHVGNGTKMNVTRSDAEQVKPGAGMEKGGVAAVEGHPKANERRKSSGGSKKSFSFFGSKKGNPAPAETSDTSASRGRFVEDIGARRAK